MICFAVATGPLMTNRGWHDIWGISVKYRARVTIAATALLIAGSSVPALAADGDTSPAVTSADSLTEAGTESDAALNEDLPIPGETAESDMPPAKTPMSNQCDPEWFFHVTQNKKNTMSVKYHTYVQNKKDYAIDFKFSSKKSGTTEVGASLTVSGETKVMILGKIKVDVNASVKHSWTSELGIETSGKVKAHSTVNGDYGIMKENVYGYKAYRYSNCGTGTKQYMTAWAPYREGWVVS
ncbi:hypothetical protein [Streptomyces sp. NPDC001914]|uniref:hypothetical protein n=2 Tax=unclassified Streptomyces TaxID=2593676 RepID=UPI00369F97CD